MPLVDTHCHLDMLENPEGALERMHAAGVRRAITIGVDAASNEWAAEFATSHPGIWATVGLHPHDAKDRTPELMARIAELARVDQVVGIGEAGLDYHYDNSPRDAQRAVFAEQVRLANEVGKALVVHTREAWDDTFAILEAEGVPERLVFHCFTGGPTEAARAVELGAVLSFAGLVTFRNAEDVRAAARETPLERILLETDSPFLTPAPHRGKVNEPAMVAYVAEGVAAARQMPLAELAEATAHTAARIFGLV
ncbi:MAG: TatD family hydrolase [Actinomycetota bacterium]